MTKKIPIPKKKYGDSIMSEEQLKSYLPKTEALKAEAKPAAVAKQVYEEPKPVKTMNVEGMTSELRQLLNDAGGRAPGYQRRLDQILSKYL